MEAQCCRWTSRNVAVAAAGFLIYSFSGAVSYAFGIFLPELVDGLHISEKAATLVGSVQAGLMLGFGIFAGGLIDILDCHVVSLIGSALVGSGYILSAFATHVGHLYLTNGVIAGVGLSLQFTPISIAVQKLFPASQRNAVTGLTSSGSGIGIFLFAPVVRTLIDNYGWRASYALIGAFHFNGIPLAILLRTRFPRETEAKCGISKTAASGELEEASNPLRAKEQTRDQCDITNFSDSQMLNSEAQCNKKYKNLRIFAKYVKEMFEFSALKNFAYCFYLFAMFLYGFGCAVPYTFLPSKAISDGVSPWRASLLVSVVGLADTLGRILAGYITVRLSSLILSFGILLLMGSINALTPVLHSFEALMVFAILYGLTYGGGVTTQVTNGVELLGVEVLAKAMGVLYTCLAIATSVSLMLAAYLWEVFDMAEAPFLLASVAVFSASMVLASLLVRHGRYSSQLMPERRVTDASEQFDVFSTHEEKA